MSYQTPQSDRLKIVLFAGGRGAATISDALAKHLRIELTLLVNAYDDGLSTGRLRKFIPGMLGPSDIRKNYSRLLYTDDLAGKTLQTLLEYRFPDKVDPAAVENTLGVLAELGPALPGNKLAQDFQNLSLGCSRRVSKQCEVFLRYYEVQKDRAVRFEFGDCSLGNIFFAGQFLLSNQNFNLTIADFCSLHPSAGTILNATQGESLTLVGLKEDNQYLACEAEIVDHQSPIQITQIFLVKDSPSESSLPSTLAERIEFLNRISVTPYLNPAAENAIREADIIIYGPGTQHSSLFPSYLTAEMASTIATNERAEKIFIANTRTDHEIQRETVNSLIQKLCFYMNQKGKTQVSLSRLVTRCFKQNVAANASASGYIRMDPSGLSIPQDKVVGTNWEMKQGVHLGGKVADEIFAIASEKLGAKVNTPAYMVSIVVPALNEERTVSKVLHELRLLNLESFGVSKEIIFVDGGSTDKTFELAKAEEGIKAFQLQPCKGRGAALRYGTQQAIGNIILFFPSDAEYDVQDLLAILPILIRQEFDVVFGSRSVKCVNLSRRIKEIYRNNYSGYFIGYYGGALLSALCFFIYKRFIADTLTGIKAFRASTLRELNLESEGLDLETEIIAKLSIRGTFILEVPVEYRPRRKEEGKKTTWVDGVKAISALFRYRKGIDADHIDHHPGVQRGEVHRDSTEESTRRAA